MNTKRTKEDEWQLIQQAAKGDGRAFEKLLTAYRRRVRSIAAEFASRGTSAFIPTEDLVQEGEIGLWSAVQRYDVRGGASFITYAATRIRGAMLDALRRNSSRSRASIVSEQAIEGAYTRLAHTLLREPTLAEWKKVLPKDLRKDLDKIASSRAGNNPLSLSETDEDSKNALCRYCESELSEAVSLVLEQALDGLDERQREIIRRRYFVPDDETWSLSELGQQFGLTESRICQVEAQAIAKLRTYMHAHYHPRPRSN